MSAETKNVKMFVEKRNGKKEEVFFDKITSRIQKLCYGLDMTYIDPPAVALKVISGLYSGITTRELDNFAAETAAFMTTKHPDYAVLAARIAITNLHKDTKEKFSDVVSDLYNYVDPNSDTPRPLFSKFHYNIVMENAKRLNSVVNHDRDFDYSYFGFKTLEKSYLLKINGKVAERPQHMLMRVAIGIHGKDIDAAVETYHYMSEKYFTHASPTLFNAATFRPQLSSCFLVSMKDDSVEGIYDTLKQCALISKCAGGIGLNIHCIRAKGALIEETNRDSIGIVPMLKVFNDTAKYVNQGGRRPGAIAVYLEPWHAEIYEFLNLGKNTGTDENRARDLFLALWIPDLFMRKVQEDVDWYLMCPNQCPGLEERWGDEFEDLYTRYVEDEKYVKKVKARDLFRAIYTAQVETGSPYMLYKDACNRKSNQQNLGTLKSSNLCTEIVQYSSPEEVAVCNLASIAVNMFVRHDKTYDFLKLKCVVKRVTKNLNKIIDVNYYPVPEAELSNKRHRPIGIGVQGLADAFILMRFPYASPEARKLNIQIFETLYYGALEASCELAAEYGPYRTYSGSPVSKGILQFDMWNVKPTDLWDWSALKKKIAEYGVRNSLLIAPMPTASTAQILGNNESIEPYTSNIYCRRVSSGDFQIVNHHLLRDLTDRDLWNEDMKNKIVAEGGSIQNIDEIPRELKELYKTAWEIPLKPYLEMAAERGAFIDQSQSMNIFVQEPSLAVMNCVHFYGWQLGLKTGMYYLRTKPAARPNQFTVDKTKLNVKGSENVKNERGNDDVNVCSLQNKGNCLSCSS